MAPLTSLGGSQGSRRQEHTCGICLWPHTSACLLGGAGGHGTCWGQESRPGCRPHAATCCHMLPGWESSALSHSLLSPEQAASDWGGTAATGAQQSRVVWCARHFKGEPQDHTGAQVWGVGWMPRFWGCNRARDKVAPETWGTVEFITLPTCPKLARPLPAHISHQWLHSMCRGQGVCMWGRPCKAWCPVAQGQWCVLGLVMVSEHTWS